MYVYNMGINMLTQSITWILKKYSTLQVKSKGHVENGEVKRKFLFSTWKLTYQNNKENPLGP